MDFIIKNVYLCRFMGAPSEPLSAYQNASRSIKKCHMMKCCEYWSIFLKRDENKFSVSEGFLVFFLHCWLRHLLQNLKIRMCLNLKLLDNSSVTESNLLILLCLSFTHNHAYHTIWQVVHLTRTPTGITVVISWYKMAIPILL